MVVLVVRMENIAPISKRIVGITFLRWFKNNTDEILRNSNFIYQIQNFFYEFALIDSCMYFITA